MVKKYTKIMFDEVANIPVYQPYAYVAMQKRISGYRYWFHRQMVPHSGQSLRSRERHERLAVWIRRLWCWRQSAR
jgi:hypothetical protein